MTKKTQKPAEIAETELEDINGGPHFRNFHRASSDFQAGCDVVLSKNDNIEIHARLAKQTKD
ncbi:MAG: hypothetical protein AAGK00_07350 [Pseudomonadota bacterium]